MSRIQVWEYLTEYENLHAEILVAVEKVFTSGRLILGESVKGFEAAFASYLSVGHGVGVNSGTDALFLALKGLDIGYGDEVLTVANTAVPTVSAIVSSGATARFVDINPDTYLMDITQLEQAITPRTKCILPVHLYGQCVDMAPLVDIARRHGLKVLEDCAQSTGATYKRRPSGSLGDLSAHSFYPTKNLGGYGDGGLVATNDSLLAERIRRLRMYGMAEEYYAEEHGYNSRLDEVQAEILSVKLKYLDGWLDRRRQLARRYEEQLRETRLVLPQTAEHNDHSFYVYVVRHPERDRIIESLKTENIFVNVSYRYPIHTMRGYASLGYGEGDLPITEKLAHEIFSLPMYPALTDEDQDRVCDVLRTTLGQLKLS